MQLKSTKWKIAQKFELRWWKEYLGKKSPEDYLDWKNKYWINFLSKFDTINLKPGFVVLDCGCGPAGIFISLPRYVNIHAEDPLINEYELHLPHFKKSNYPHVVFHAISLEQFDSAIKFDTIFCINAINHVSNITFCYDKLVSLLKPSGQLIISIDAHKYTFFKYFYRIFPVGDVKHPHQYDLNEYTSFLEKRGLKILKTEKIKTEFLFNHYVQVATNQND